MIDKYMVKYEKGHYDEFNYVIKIWQQRKWYSCQQCSLCV